MTITNLSNQVSNADINKQTEQENASMREA